MSLNARDRQALSRIEENLTSSDPRFAARLSAFARLADGEGMPARERIPPGARRIRPRFPCPSCLRRTGAAWILWLVLVLAMITVTVVLIRSGPEPVCARQQGLACVQRSVPPAPSSPGGHARGTPGALSSGR